jgi:hypothetical protein
MKISDRDPSNAIQTSTLLLIFVLSALLLFTSACTSFSSIPPLSSAEAQSPGKYQCREAEGWFSHFMTGLKPDLIQAVDLSYSIEADAPDYKRLNLSYSFFVKRLKEKSSYSADHTLKEVEYHEYQTTHSGEAFAGIQPNGWFSGAVSDTMRSGDHSVSPVYELEKNRTEYFVGVFSEDKRLIFLCVSPSPIDLLEAETYGGEGLQGYCGENIYYICSHGE